MRLYHIIPYWNVNAKQNGYQQILVYPVIQFGVDNYISNWYTLILKELQPPYFVNILKIEQSIFNS